MYELVLALKNYLIVLTLLIFLIKTTPIFDFRRLASEKSPNSPSGRHGFSTNKKRIEILFVRSFGLLY